MRSTFYRQIEPCARNGLPARPSPVAKGKPSPPIPRAIGDKPAPDRTLVHKTQAAFLKALIAYEDGEASRQLRDRLAKADRRLAATVTQWDALPWLLTTDGAMHDLRTVTERLPDPANYITTSTALGSSGIDHYGVRTSLTCANGAGTPEPRRDQPAQSPGAA